ATGEAATPPLRHNGSVGDALFSLDSKRILVVGKDDTVRLWELFSASEVGSPTAFNSDFAVPAQSAAVNGRRLTKLPDGDAVQVTDAVTGAPLGPPLRHSSLVTHAAFSPDGRRVVTASDDDTAQVWDAVSGDRLIPPLAHKGTVLDAEFSPDGTRLV